MNSGWSTQNIEKQDVLGQQICDVVLRVCKLELNNSQRNDAYEDILNGNTDKIVVSSRLRGFDKRCY